MDKNIAAILREDTFTIDVKFIQDSFKGAISSEEQYSMGQGGMNFSNKNYTYIATDKNIKANDFVVVTARGILQVALVVGVHDELQIAPDEATRYQYVVGRVDMNAYNVSMEKNKEIEKIVSTAYTKNARRQFAQLLLADMDEESRTKLLGINTPAPKKKTKKPQGVDKQTLL